MAIPPTNKFASTASTPTKFASTVKLEIDAVLVKISNNPVPYLNVVVLVPLDKLGILLSPSPMERVGVNASTPVAV